MESLCLAVLVSTLVSSVSTSRPSQFPGAVPGPDGDLQTTIKTGYTCEGEELFIQCGEEETIQIVRANYGRFSIAICNEEGKTHWSVNCMSPKTRHILQNRCDRLNSCSVPVSSSLFGDPCPGTHKYVEIHYTCSPKTDTTRRPLPPWYLQQPSLQSHSDNWLPNPASHSEDVTSGNSYSSRIPILVATTTSQPRRIPITTPRPTTTTSSTTTEESVTSDLYAEDEDEVTVPQVDVTQEVIEEVEEDTPVEDTLTVDLTSDLTSEVAPSLEEIPEEELAQYCGPSTARSLSWKVTRAGQLVVQPCPNGATGLARWQCVSSHSDTATWLAAQPDLTDCKSVPMTNLEVKVRQEDPENVLASSLARLTGSRRLYGGDLQSAVAVMRTVASRVQYLLQQREDNFYKKEAFIQEVLLNIVRAASNLLDVKNKEAWGDLEPAQQMKTASSLLLAMEENAALFAEVTTKPEILMESSYNILMAISVLNVRDVRNGSSFPLNNYEEPYGTVEDGVFLHPRALQSQASDNLVKAVFFSFKRLEEILSRGHKRIASPHSSLRYNSGPEQILNSRIISASLVGGQREEQVGSPPVRVSLRHLRQEGVGSPTCVTWDLETSSWSSAGCTVLTSNRTRTVCQCQHRAHFALLMEEQNAPIVIQLPAFHVEIIVGAVMAVLVLVTVLALFKFREQVQKFVLKSPCFKEEKKGLEPCHKSQSFFNGINLMPTAGGEDKTQTMSTAVTDTNQRLSQFVMSGAALTLPHPQQTMQENVMMQADRYENIDGEQDYPGDQATLPLRARMSPHITLNPYSTQLVDNINRMMAGGHIYQVANMAPMSPHLTHLTNTLKKKKCVGGHSGPCQHSDSSVRSEADTESEILPSSDVVFRAVSPHGHVYWEIDPKRPNKLSAGGQIHSDEDTNNDLHNMSDFSEDEARAAASDRSRQSSSRFSDSRPLINSSPCHLMSPLPESLASVSPSPAQRFHSLQKAPGQMTQMRSPGFSTRTRLSRPGPRLRGQEQDRVVAVPEHFHQLQSADFRRNEHVQQQVQIPDLRRIPVTVKSSEYIMAKIQNHMAGTTGHRQTKQGREREV